MTEATKKMLAELEARWASKTLTADFLSQAVRTEDEIMVRDSVGTYWLFNYNRPRYADVFTVGDIDPMVFLRNHLDVGHFVRAALSGGFITLLPVDRRVELVREAYLGLNYAYLGLAAAGLESGIAREDLAGMIYARLDKIVVREGCSNMLDDFLARGLDLGTTNSDGSIFDDATLKDLMLMAARKAPTSVLRYQQNIKTRLDEESVVEICKAAAEHLTSLRCLGFGHFVRIQNDEKARIVSRVAADGNNTTLLCELAVDLVFKNVLDPHRATGRGILEKLPGMTLFMVAIKAGEKDLQSTWCWDASREYFYERLFRAGYNTGLVYEDSFQHKTRGTVRQMAANTIHGDKYVFDDRSHRWYPSKGDRVIIDTGRARRLTSKVSVAYFIPLDKEARWG
ncbi:MAG: hypothetical protein KBC81_00260 [Candidatus Pacebacteria bacterium]|nr:hypothetical protein [Candidatus Paceibacterota bacterium]